MLSAAAEATAEAELWGDHGAGLNLEGLDDWQEPQYVDVEGLVAQLLSAQDDLSTYLPILQQLASPETPPYAIIGSEQWLQLAQLLPHLLASTHERTAALAVQLLQQQLAPELLHCSPEPLGQLLTALLLAAHTAHVPGTAAVQQDQQQQNKVNIAGRGPSVPSVPDAAHAASDHEPRNNSHKSAATGAAAVPAAAGTGAQAGAPEYLQYPAAVLQFMTDGLQKLGRQWHFLDEPLAVALCAALASVLLEPLLIALDNHPTSAAAAAPGLGDSKSGSAARQQQQEEQCQQQQPLAVQLLLCDPMLFWLQRLNANAASSRPLKAAAVQQDLPQQLLLWAEQWVVHSGRLGSSTQGTQQVPAAAAAAAVAVTSASGGDACAATKQQGCTHGQQLEQQPQQFAAVSAVAAKSTSSRCSAFAKGISNNPGSRMAVLCDCVAAHCLAALVGTPSGRRVLQGLSLAGQLQPLDTALVCLQGWADLQEQRPAQQQPNQQQQGTEHGQGPGQASSSSPFPPWGPIRPACLGPSNSRRTGTPECGVLSLHGDACMEQLTTMSNEPSVGQSEPDAAISVGVGVGASQVTNGSPASPSSVSVDAVVKAAAATAAWALKAYEGQKPWFPL